MKLPALKPRTALEREALAACNEIRAKMGKPPVDRIARGVPCWGDYCPIANTIGDCEVGPGLITTGALKFAEPLSVMVFRRLFDAGHLPRFEE